jgi:hypothetical protein
LTIVQLEEEQEKDKYCKDVRNKYEETIRIKELLNDIEIEMKLKKNNEIRDSHRDDDEGYLSEDNNIDDDEEVIEVDNGLLGTTAVRILVPESLKEKILKRFHDSPYAGQLGIKKTAARIQRRFKWPKMAKEIKEYVRGWEICAKKSDRKSQITSKTQFLFQIPSGKSWPWTSWDLLTQSGKERNHYILVMGKYLKRYIITAPMPDQTAGTVARTFVNNVILIHGNPVKVLTDQGTNFQSDLISTLYKQYGITRIKTTAQNSQRIRPQCDRMVERVNRTLADIIASYISEEPSKWSDFLPSATFAYNTAVHSSTGYSPFYLMYGREATEPQDMIQPVRNRDMTDVNMIFSQTWYDAVEKTKEKLEEAKEN